MPNMLLLLLNFYIKSYLFLFSLTVMLCEFLWILESDKVSKFGNFGKIWSNFGVKKVIFLLYHGTIRHSPGN